MSVLNKSYKYLNQILSKEESFTNILNHGIGNDNLLPNDEKIVKDTIKSAVNKYYFLKYEVNYATSEFELSEGDKNVLVVALSMYHYVKNIDKNYLISCFNSDYEWFVNEVENFTLEEDFFIDFLRHVGREPIALKDDDKKAMSKKLSLQFSYPEWIIQMHFKHFGFKDTFKSIHASRHNSPLIVNYNPMLIDRNELDEKMFRKNKLSVSSYTYLGKDKIIELPLFKENKIFVEDEASQLLIDVLDPRQGDDILFVNDSKGILALDTALRVGDFAHIEVACKDIISLNNTRKLIKRFNLKSIYAFESDMKLLITHVAEKSFDKVLVVPQSSALGLVRKRPDVLLTLKRQDLDAYIADEKYALNEASRFVKENGYLLYSVFTMNRKEGELLVKEFLDENKSFTLIEDRQIFPYMSLVDGFYYALMKKGENNED